MNGSRASDRAATGQGPGQRPGDQESQRDADQASQPGGQRIESDAGNLVVSQRRDEQRRGLVQNLVLGHHRFQTIRQRRGERLHLYQETAAGRGRPVQQSGNSAGFGTIRPHFHGIRAPW